MMEGAVVMLVVVAIPVGLWILVQWHKDSQNKEFAGYLGPLAARVSGRVEMTSGRLKPRLVFERAGAQAQLGLLRTGKHLFIEFNVSFPRPLGFHLYLTPGTGALVLLVKPMSLERIKLNRPSIDDNFYLACSDQEAASRFLDDEIREKLERRKDSALFHELLVKKEKLTMTSGLFKDPADLGRMLDLGIDFLDRLALVAA